MISKVVTIHKLRNGEDGKDGPYIKQTITEYYLSTSSVTPTGGTWSVNMTYTKGKYLWKRYRYTWSDGRADTYSDPVMDPYSTLLGTKLTYIGEDGIYSGFIVADNCLIGEQLSVGDVFNVNAQTGIVTFGENVRLAWGQLTGAPTVKDGDDGQSAFTSYMFKRSKTVPTDVLTNEGAFNNPSPTNSKGWSDGVPEGTDPVYMQKRLFTSDGKSPQDASWSVPSILCDTADIDICFSAKATKPSDPTTHGVQNDDNWHNEATENDIWMAISKKVGGVWGSWEISKIKGEQGIPGVGTAGQSVFTSYMFKRSKTTPTDKLTTEGSYNDPSPTNSKGWTDGIPTGVDTVYMQSRMFSSDGKSPQQSTWTDPKLLADTAYLDVCYSSSETKPSNPTTHGVQNDSIWHNDATENDIWMAMSVKSAGVWGDWQVMKIKGEKGDNTSGDSVTTSTIDLYQVVEGAGTPSLPANGTTLNRGSWSTTVDFATISAIIEYNKVSTNTTKKTFKVWRCIETEIISGLSSTYKYSDLMEDSYLGRLGTMSTYIGADGIYTGELVADKIYSIGINAGKGVIGGWEIGENVLGMTISTDGFYDHVFGSQDSYDTVVCIGNQRSVVSGRHAAPGIGLLTSKSLLTINTRDGFLINKQANPTTNAWLDAIQLRLDGSGMLANGNIAWDKDGNITAINKITAKSGTIGGWTIMNNEVSGLVVDRRTETDGTYALFGTALGHLVPGVFLQTNDLSNTSKKYASILTPQAGFAIGPGTTGNTSFATELKPDGSGKMANGNFKWDVSGNIAAKSIRFSQAVDYVDDFYSDLGFNGLKVYDGMGQYYTTYRANAIQASEDLKLQAGSSGLIWLQSDTYIEQGKNILFSDSSSNLKITSANVQKGDKTASWENIIASGTLATATSNGLMSFNAFQKLSMIDYQDGGGNYDNYLKLKHPGSNASSLSLRNGGATLSSTEAMNLVAGSDFEMNADDGYMIISSNDFMELNSGDEFSISAASISCSPSIEEWSDIRVKDIIEDDEHITVDALADAPFFKFNFVKDREKENKRLFLGTSAQYWNDICPELVYHSKKRKNVREEDFIDKEGNELDEILTLNYTSLAVGGAIALAKKVKEQQKEIDELKAQILEIKKTLFYANEN